MQFCSLKSLLTLARCSRFTLAAAADRFAWRCVPALLCKCGRSPRQVTAQVSASLVRFGLIQLNWNAPDSYDHSLVQADLTGIAALPLQRLAITGVSRIRAEQIRGLTEGLQQSLTTLLLKELDFFGQSIGDEGAIAVAELLSCCPQLSYVGLDSCNISDAGCESLAAVLAAHPSIVSADFSHNPIRSRGLTALLPAIQHRLEETWLHNCQLKDADFSLLLHALMHSDRMKMCTYFGNPEVHSELHQSAITELRKRRPQLDLQD
jgi:hypothetical protein